MTRNIGVDSRGTSLPGVEGLERVLLEHQGVHDAVIVPRRDQQGKPCIIAYVVPADVRAIETLPVDLQARLPVQSLPDGYVFLSCLPRDENGGVAVAELERYEVIDAGLLDRWKEVLGSLCPVEIVPVERTPRVGSVHRLDLLPGVPAGRGEVSAPAAQPPAGRKKEAQTVVPAVAHGRPLIESSDDPKTLGQALRRAAERHGDNGIIYVRQDGTKETQSYAQLLSEAGEVLAGLAKLGLKPGDKVILQLGDNREFLTAFWGCMLGGMVPAPISIASGYAPSNATVQKLVNAWQLLEQPLILASDDLVAGLRSALDLSGADRAHVQSMAGLRGAAAIAPHDARPDDLALILFTSGSTGVPKGVMQSHRSLLCMANGTIQHNGFTTRDVTLNWMPLEHVGAISFLHTMPVVLGCRQVHVPTDYILQDPLRWLDLFEELAVSISWGPNFAFSLINERAEGVRSRQRDLSSMRFLVSAGELVVSNTTRRFLDLLSGCGLSPQALRPAFGMSETCSGITWSGGYRPDAIERDNPFVDLGPPIPSSSLRIVDDKERTLNEGEIGRLQLKGPSVTSGYYRNPEATQKAFTRDGWFDTGDLGFLRDGLLTLTGREKDEIIVNGVNYVAAEIEAVVDAVDGVEVSYSAACAVRACGSDTDELAIFFCPSASAQQNPAGLLGSIRERVASEVGVSPTYIVPLDRNRIPKTAIGKIQRAELRRRFESGEFNAILKHAELLTETNTVPEWFHRKEWRPREISSRLDSGDLGTALVFVDSSGLGAALCSALRKTGRPCIAVEAGTDFVRLDRERYRLDPKNREHYRRLIQALREDDLHISRIVHLWTCDEDAAASGTLQELIDAQHRGFYSVLFLVQALAGTQDPSRTVNLHVVGHGAQVTSSADTGSGTHATVIGLLKTIPHEFNWLRCRHVDLESDSMEKNVRHVLDELHSVTTDDEVAYRNGRRLVWCLAPIDLRREEPAELPLRRGGIYLITGGLGGVGAYLATVLIRDYQAKLILVGTTSLPDRAEWNACLERGGKIADRIRRYREIESLGGEVVYEAVDVADEARLGGVVAAAEARWGNGLAGVFHLAAGGDVASHWQNGERNQIANASAESVDPMFRSKVYGTWVLYRIVQQRPDAIMVCFSSVLGIFGAARLGPYVAAHTFMRNFTLHRRHHHHPRSYVFSWTVWKELGLSKAEPAFAKDLYRALGYFLIPKELGLDSLIGGLSRDLPDLIVGLDAGNPNIRKHLATEAQPLQKIVAYFTAPEDDTPDQSELTQLHVQDRFGVSSRCELVRLEAMPLTGTGEVDREALRRTKPDTTGAARERGTPPGTDVERQIAAIWSDVLGGREPGLDESFFQLGGNSLSATRVISRLGELFQVRLEVRDMLEQGSIRRLADLVTRRQNRRDADPERGTLAATEIEALLMGVDQMSDEEVADLLGSLAGKGNP